MTSETRSATEVFEDHLQLALQGDVETDIARNFAPDCVLLTSFGVFYDHEGVRKAAALLANQVPNAQFSYRNRLVEGEIAFLEWTAVGDGVFVEDGADSFLVRDGLIQVMTIHYTPSQADF